MVYCETKYIPANKVNDLSVIYFRANQFINTKLKNLNKVLYTITWKKGQAEWTVSSERSASGAINAFLKVNFSENINYLIVFMFNYNI